MSEWGQKALRVSPSDRTVAALLRDRAQGLADAPFLLAGGEAWTFSEAAERAALRAGTLREAGIEAGDRLVALLPNGPLLVELFLACAWSGAVLVPMNTASRGPQLAHVIGDCDPKIVIASDAFLAEFASVDTISDGSTALWVADNASARNVVPQIGSAPSLEMRECRPSDPLAILYTSGTTGPPKGVVCPHAQFWWWGHNTGNALGITDDDVLFTCLPLFHTNALNTVVQSLFHGVKLVIGERFSASRFWQTVIDADASVTYILGAMAAILAARDRNPNDSAHRVRVALSPATSPPLWDVFRERFGIQIVDGHGMTETNLTIGPRDGEQRPGWMGRVMPGFQAKLVDADGNDVQTGTPGELVVRANETFAFATGYWRLPNETAESWRDQWFHTGDRVVADGDGWFRFLDRIKDAIRRRGENVSAWEVEQALTAHPQVVNAAAVPVPSPLGEDDVMAFVVCADPAPTQDELTTWADERLPYFAVPRYLEYLADLPLTENGKIRKYVLRERGLSETTWDRERDGAPRRR
ncbi:Acyl-CoA synthetase (AMP-forming)/AMP-acid ligase II [Gaiella occulta]|uniref:Acyl-CoA synthetase (AMP-forming)/AMP-acid ligase II n=1 Tax=Gaiella occulta TaxID=1002870 RepID=A0A7M2YUQ9_9ACTN|nr:AMP-binding protein [Gaiella occulta]RDI73207.1 Acyl-CoA synthetase (AMP-forming)/AMP-acid ligase II [Gaiella occulta]